MLPPIDAEYVGDRYPAHQVSGEAGMLCVLFPAFPLPPGLNISQSDLLLRLPPGYSRATITDEEFERRLAGPVQ